jgi:hypothetical protein
LSPSIQASCYTIGWIFAEMNSLNTLIFSNYVP